MPVEKPSDRLRKARIRAGFPTAADFARHHHLEETTYRSTENGTRGLTVAKAILYAKLLGHGTTRAWLLVGEQPESPVMIGLIGYIGAGESIYPFDDEQAFDQLPAPPGMLGGKAAIVRGASMLPVYRDGDILYFDAEAKAHADAIGRDCMVQIVDGPRQIKRVLRGGKRNTFRLFSYATHSESDDVKLEWAAPVLWVQRAQ